MTLALWNVKDGPIGQSISTGIFHVTQHEGCFGQAHGAKRLSGELLFHEGALSFRTSPPARRLAVETAVGTGRTRMRVVLACS